MAAPIARLGRLICFLTSSVGMCCPFVPFSAPACIKILCPKEPDFYTPLALKTAKGQHLPALEVYKTLVFTMLLVSSLFSEPQKLPVQY